MAAELADLAIDLRQYHTPLVVGTPEPRLDFETKEPKRDANGDVVFVVALNLTKVRRDGAKKNKTVVMDVQVTCPLIGLDYGTPVQVENLTVSTWEITKDFWGVSFRADNITALRPVAPSPVVGPAPAAAAGSVGRGKVGD